MSFVLTPRNVTKMRNHTLPKFRHGTESFEVTDGFPRNSLQAFKKKITVKAHLEILVCYAWIQ